MKPSCPLRKTVKPKMDLFSSPRAEVRVQRFSLFLLWFQPTQWPLLQSNNPECTCLNFCWRTKTEVHELTWWTPFVHSACFALLPFLISLHSFCYPVHSFTLKQCLDLSCLSLLLHILLSLFQTHLLHKKYYRTPAKLSACCAGYQQFWSGLRLGTCPVSSCNEQMRWSY